MQRGRGRLPVADYRLACEVDTTGWYDPQHGEVPDASKDERGVYSFCMCPGGQIVPTSTDPELLCINGMSFSK